MDSRGERIFVRVHLVVVLEPGAGLRRQRAHLAHQLQDHRFQVRDPPRLLCDAPVSVGGGVDLAIEIPSATFSAEFGREPRTLTEPRSYGTMAPHERYPMTTSAMVVCTVVLAFLQTGCSSGPTAADIKMAATAVQGVATAVQSATPAQVEAAVTSINTPEASGWVRKGTQVREIRKKLTALQHDLASLPVSGADSLASILEGTSYPLVLKADLLALTEAYFADMPTRKAADRTRFDIGLSALQPLKEKLAAAPSLGSAEAPAFFCARTIVERLAGLSTLTIDTATTATATAQLNTALCLGQ